MGGGREREAGTRNFVCYIGWAPASCVYPKKYTVYQPCKKKKKKKKYNSSKHTQNKNKAKKKKKKKLAFIYIFFS